MKQFDRDFAMETPIPSPEDQAHTAATQSFENSVMRDSLTNERVGAGHVPQILFGSYCHVNEAKPIRASGPSMRRPVSVKAFFHLFFFFFIVPFSH